MIKVIVGIVLFALFIDGEIQIEKEDEEFLKEFGFYPSHEGWD